MNDLKERLKKIRNDEKNVHLNQLIKTYKSLILINPINHEHWYQLGSAYLSKNSLKNAYTTLCNAKKLGSIKAINKLSEILTQYKKSNANFDLTKIQNKLEGN